MTKKKDNVYKPAQFPACDTEEQDAIAVFSYIIDRSKVKTEPASRDKKPNVDGFLSIVDEDSTAIAELEYQLKKLPPGAADDPKFSCPISLFAYSDICLNPVLLICCDIDNEVAYWIYICDELKEKFKSKISQNKSITLHFPPENVIKKNNNTYIYHWVEICNDLINLRDNGLLLQKENEELRKISNPALGISGKQIEEIHKFLDILNGSLDNEYLKVKQILYPGSWKIGIAYSYYNTDGLSYSLFPIPLDVNDLHIKQLDPELRKSLQAKGCSFTSYFGNNPIKSDPKVISNKIIKEKIEQILKYKFLNHENEFLAQEYFFSVIDCYLTQCDLESKDTYSIEDLNHAHLSIHRWVKTALFYLTNAKNQPDYIKNHMSSRRYYDLDLIISSLSEDERLVVKKLIHDSQIETFSIPSIPIASRKFIFRHFSEFYQYLKRNRIKQIFRPYPKKDYSLTKIYGDWIYSVHNPDDVNKKMHVFFNNLFPVYNSIVQQNFPLLFNDLSLFNGSNVLFIQYQLFNKYSMNQQPVCDILGLKNDSLEKWKIDIVDQTNKGLISYLGDKQVKLPKEIKGTIINERWQILDFIFDDLPMMNFIYKHLLIHFEKLYKI